MRQKDFAKTTAFCDDTQIPDPRARIRITVAL